jgi:hypothetical protein
MSLPRKGQRRIAIGGMTFVWAIRRKPTYDQECFSEGIHVAVQVAARPHVRLIVWSAIPHPKNYLATESGSVTPREVRGWIEQALSAGWDLAVSGVTIAREQPRGTLRLEAKRKKQPSLTLSKG